MDEVTIRAALRDELSRPMDDVIRTLRRLERQTDEVDRVSRRAATGSGMFSNGLARIDSVGRLASRTMMTTARVGGTLAALAGGALATGLGIAAGVGIKTAASMQNASVAFTTMLGSGKAAHKFLGQLQTFAAKTPFEFPELQSAASSLISVGIDANKVIPIMTTLGDVTSGMGTGSEGIQRATVALQQMTAAQRISAEDLNQLRDAGIPVYDLLASALGKTKGQVVALAQKGKLGQKELGLMMNALETGKGLERFNGLMKKQSATLGGAWSNLSDAVKMGLANALAPAIPILTHLTDKAGALAKSAGGPVKNAIKWLVDTGSGLVQAWGNAGLDGVVSSLGATFGHDFAPALATAKDDLSALWKIVQAILPDIGAMTGGSGLGGALSTLGLLNPLMQTAGDHAWAVGKAAQAIAVGMAAAKVGAMGYAAWQAIANGAAVIATSVAWLNNAAFLASNTTLAIWLGLKWLEVTAWLRSTAVAGAHTAVLWAQNAVMLVVRGATLLWAAAQWALNAAMTANPIGLIVLAVAALVAGVIYAYQHFGWFKTAVDATWGALKTAGVWIWNTGKKVVEFAAKFSPLGLEVQAIIALFDLARDHAAQLLGPIKSVVDAVGKAGGAVGSFVGSHFGGGDTAVPRGAGGNWASTAAAVGAVAGPGIRATSGLRTFGLGSHNSDHRHGRAVDLVGSGLGGVKTKIERAGGYAAYHGSGPARHLHVVPAAGSGGRGQLRPTGIGPVGDTSSARRVGGAGGAIVVAAGAVQVTVNGDADTRTRALIKAEVRAGIAAAIRDAQERG